MKTYIGTKIVQAVPGKLVNGCMWPEGLPLPEETPVVQDQNEDEKNCRTQIDEGYFFPEGNGYPQFLPKDEFENIFRPAENMSFGLAIEAAKGGKKIARKGWNGKNQYVELATNISYVNAAGETVNADHAAIGNKALAFVGTSGVQIGWLASQSDMLAEDWYIVE